MDKKIKKWMAVGAIALVVTGVAGCDMHQKQKDAQTLIEKAKEMQQKANEAFNNGQKEQAKLYLDSCEHYLNLLEKRDGQSK